MKIMFVITGLGMGGAEKVVTSLADAFAEKGHHVLIAYLTGDALVLPANPAIRIVDLHFKQPTNIIAAYFRFRRLVIDFKPDIVHSHMVHANILARLLRISTSLPRLISTAHSSNEGGRLRMLAYRLTDRLADISTNVSDEAVAAFIERKAANYGRMVTVHNGISTINFSFSFYARATIRQQLGIKDNCKLILAVGRLNDAKDYPNLFRALQRVNTSSIDFKVFIVGDGPLRGKLQAMMRELHLNDCVELLGTRHDVAKLMCAADVFVLSSAWEGFPLVVGEAMACECVVVATDCGGVSEFIGSTGYLVPCRRPAALAEALAAALALSPSASKTLGQAARQRVQDRYSLDAAVEKWLQLYNGIDIKGAV
ncbi:MAG: glycosyltransferase [Polaromonas sp.]